jgi:L-lactate dehydrogenase complex protein LldG
MAARENILGRIRERLHKPAGATDPERQTVSAYLSAHAHSPRPRCDWDPEARFRERALGLGSTVDEIDSIAAVPAAVARYLSAHSLPPRAVCWAELAGLDWPAAGVQVMTRPAGDSDLVGMTGAFCAIAETGTLVTLSGTPTPATVSLLPETHIAVVSRSRIVRGMEEAWALIRDERGGLPRAVSFISGPSRTADIEQTVTLGVHGPYRVHIIVVR